MVCDERSLCAFWIRSLVVLVSQGAAADIQVCLGLRCIGLRHFNDLSISAWKFLERAIGQEKDRSNRVVAGLLLVGFIHRYSRDL